jgi:hypothetical protein
MLEPMHCQLSLAEESKRIATSATEREFRMSCNHRNERAH